MTGKTLITKASGEKEPFSAEKLENSLRRAGAEKEAIIKITDEIYNWLYEGVSTKKIYRQAFRLLKKYKRGTAARYRLKKAIMELGPTGYPFEHFVGQLIKHYGYDIRVSEIVQGQCVKHEVDVVAKGNGKEIFVECKFYNSQGKNASVRVPLYIHSRVNDIINKRNSLQGSDKPEFLGWIVTNTGFTTDATDYGKCAGLHLVSWNYPAEHSLRDMIEKESFFPVTTLTTINKQQKKILLDDGIVLCRQIHHDHSVVSKLEITPAKREKLLAEVKELCSVNNCK
ncbi:MAG: restriction endonuclease [Bacteroidales bacterium]